MNPLDMTGPEFLRFYLGYGLSVLLTAGLLRWLLTRSTVASLAELRWIPGHYPRDEEAYCIALLRGGRSEAARALLARLISAGILIQDGKGIRRSPSNPDEAGLSTLEWKALGAVGAPQPLRQATANVAQALAPDLARFEEELERQGLAPTRPRRQALGAIFWLAMLAVPALGVAKLLVALSRGRTNVFFLLSLLGIYAAVTWVFLRPPHHTESGRDYLRWLRETHEGLARKVREHRRTGEGELVLAAGIFGLAALPALLPPPIPSGLKPKERESTSGCGGGHVDGGGSSSGGSSCGGGDGGGGGGGGCGGGGCGGCGS